MATQPPSVILSSISTDRPLVLLPVRIETRFNNSEAPNYYYLDVRIYPDEIHINSHEPELTQDELTWGKQYLGVETYKRKSAWRQLAERFGPQRAAWIIKTLGETPDQTASRSSSWTKAPSTMLLPDKWVVIGYKDSERKFCQEGKTITDPLMTGPTPTVSHTSLTDAGMKWLVDFPEAVKIGMALSIPISADVAKTGLDRLIVIGVKASLSATEQSQQLSLATAASIRLNNTFEAHHYTRGLSFVPQGTPTNNTPASPSGYNSSDPGYELSYRIEQAGDLCRSGDGTNGDVLAKALGIGPATFARVRFAGELNPLAPKTGDTVDGGREQIDARHMNTALWSATWGYYLTQLMAGSFADPLNTVSKIRHHFIDFVRARGPLPALRIGPQPYGILPVTSLQYWNATSQTDKDLDPLAKLLKSLRPLWLSSLSGVPHIGSAGNSQESLMQSLSIGPTSCSYAVRNVLGPQFVTYYWNFVRRYCGNHWWAKETELARSVLRAIGLDSLHPRIINFVTGGGAFNLTDTLVQGGTLSETEPLDLNYIDWIRTTAYETIRKKPGFDFQGNPIPLLYLLLRHAKLLEYVNAAFRIKPSDPSWRSLEAELVNINPAEKSLTVWDQLRKPVDSSANSPSIGSYLDTLKDNTTDQRVMELVEFQNSLNWLKDRPTAVLERLLPETLDLCTHRLDAWITSLATRRMAAISQKDGLYLGGYGWVEELRPASSPSTNGAAGFIQAPSMTHAAAAALLRNGYLSHGKVNGNGAFAVNLSSERVRLALWLLDGVRQGQPLGAMLGYRFERGLHERKLDNYIAVFRRLAPLCTESTAQQSADAGPQLTPAQETVAANNVVDGLALQKRWKKGQTTNRWTPNTIPFGNQKWGLSKVVPYTTDYQGIKAELDALETGVDAVSDLLIAESVYQVARGNLERASAVLDTLGRGDAPPPSEIEVVNTPRTGIGLTHRLFVPLSNNLTNPTGWPSDLAGHERALAEPNLNVWVGQLIGDPSMVLCQATYFDGESGAILAGPIICSVGNLALAPLDFLYMTQGSDEAQRSELEQRLAYWLMDGVQRPRNVGPDAGVSLTFARDPSWTSDILSVTEFLEVVGAIRKVVTSSRALEPGDLSWPENSSLSKLNMNDLQGRAQQAVDNFNIALKDLSQFIASLESALEDVSAEEEVDVVYLNDLRGALFRLSYFGIQGAIPSASGSNTSKDCSSLLAQAKAVKTVAQQRADMVNNLSAPTGPGTSATMEEQEKYLQAQRDYNVKRLQGVFGPDFKVLYRFEATEANGNLKKAFDHSKELQDDDPLISFTWFQRIARVRDGAARLENALTRAGAVNFNARLGFHVGQLPYTDGDRWVALPEIKPTTDPPPPPIPAGRLSLVALTTDALTPASTGPQPLTLADLSGLLVDEWVEVVPNRRETTGIAFNYQEPGTRPAQAILLAIAPGGQTQWTLETLEATVLEALELAKLRAVDPDLLQGVGQFLPALFFALNQSGDTVTTDFRRVASTRE